MKIFIAIALILGFAPSVWAVPAISCHCFQDRSYDPTRPDAADDYFLATTQNALLATVFDISKRDVVKAKMANGASGEELWVVHYLHASLGLDPESLAASRQAVGSWGEALEAIRADVDALPEGLAEGLKDHRPDDVIAKAVVDEVLSSRLGIDTVLLDQVRRQGVGSKEVILACFLGRESGTSPADLVSEVRVGRASWGALFDRYKIEPSQIEFLLRQFAKPQEPLPEH